MAVIFWQVWPIKYRQTIIVWMRGGYAITIIPGIGSYEYANTVKIFQKLLFSSKHAQTEAIDL